MVHYLYDHEYRAEMPPGYDQMTRGLKRQSNLRQHLECYYLADKYGIETMKDHAASKAKLIIEMERLWLVDFFPEIAKSVFENTPESDRMLRSAMLKYCTDNIKILMLNPVFEETMDSVDGFWKEVLREQACITHISPDWVKCITCKKRSKVSLPNRTDEVQIPCFACGKWCGNLMHWMENLVPRLEMDEELKSEDSDDSEDGSSAETRSRKRRRVSADE